MKSLVVPTISVKKYGGKQVAVVHGKIVASGTTAGEVIARVRRKLPRASWRDILLISVPEGVTVVYRV